MCEDFKILSLDGGGYKGLYTISLLAELEKKFRRSCFEIFDLFAGTSTGSIIALALAMGKEASEIQEMYLNLGKKIFGKKRKFSPIFNPFYNINDLYKYLDDIFESKTLKTIHKNGKRVIIPASNISDISPRIFKTDYTEDLDQHNDYKLADIATASCAAPMYFQTHKITKNKSEEIFADGGLFANNPAVCAIIEAMAYNNQKIKNIKVVSIGTSNCESLQKNFKINKGLKDWKENLILNTLELTSKSQEHIASFIFNQNKSNYLRISPSAQLNMINLDNINESKLLINEAINTYNKVKNEKLIIDLFENKKEKVIIKEDIEMEVTNG